MTDQHPPHAPSEPDNKDAIIELTDVVAMPETTDDNIIELTDVVARDARDTGRASSPMRPADDAHLLDTSNLSIEAAFDAAVVLIDRSRG